LLVAITKYVDTDIVRALYGLGVSHFGESRPQELWRKAQALREPRDCLPGLTWHLVGHLQRNKIERTLPVAGFIHSVDSVRLLKALETEGNKHSQPVQVLLEFNLSGEPSKHGFSRVDLPSVMETWSQLRYVRIRGLMTMAALTADPVNARPTFAALRELREEIQRRMKLAEEFHHLSMGMTNDFEVAIEEGATLLRIGSALFKGLETGPHD
jgi:hypothetical protein